VTTLPAAHVFSVDHDWYAYDLNTQQLVQVEAPLAALLRQEGVADEDAVAALSRAQEADGLFLARKVNLAPARPSAAVADRTLQHLVLTVTESCNLRCAYCLHGAGLAWVRPHGSGHMSIETAVAAVAYFLDRSDPDRAPVISFYGGEALLNRALVTAAIAAARSHARGAEVRFAIDSNGLLLDAEVINLIAREKIHLQLSIDGPADVHDRHRLDVAGRPTFGRIAANIGALLDVDRSAAARITYVVTLAPPVDLFAVAEVFAAFPPYLAHGITNQPLVTVNFANLKGQHWPGGQEAVHGLPPVPEQVNRARELYLAALAQGRRNELSPVLRALFEPDLIRFHHRSRAPLGETYAPGGNCRPGRRKLHVTVDGRLQPCERTGNTLALGKVATGIQPDLVARLHDDFHAALRMRCGQCWAVRQCGVCFAALGENPGPPGAARTIPESVCRRVRSHRESVMQMMVRILGLPPESRLWLDQSQLS
jgi:uncharacterized protein